MMTITPEMKRFIREEIRLAANIIMSGSSGKNDKLITEDIEQNYPGKGNPTFTDRPITRTWGVVSRAPRGTIQVTGRQGDHPGNRLVLGHRDANPPKVDEGETKVYSIGTYHLYAAKDGIFVGKGESKKPLIIGDAGNEFFGMLLDLLIQHVHPGPGSPPTNALQLTQLKTEYITGKKLLSSKDGGLG